jgi:hypothetical protein
LPPEPAAVTDDDEKKRARLAAALFGFVAVVQLLAMLIGPKDPISLFWQFAVALPAGAFALGWWHGRRPRVASIAFALLWAALNTVAAVQLVRFAETLANEPSLVVARVPRWFIPLLTASSISFTAAALVIVTGRPSRGRRIAGAALGAVFALLVLAQHVLHAR